MLETRIALGLLVLAIVGTSIISFSLVGLTPDVIQAFAAAPLNSKDVAKFMIVKINVERANNGELVYGTFSRIGFVSGENNFLLESLPSVDKKSFYEIVQKSLKSKGSIVNPVLFDVKIEIFSGGYDHIETLDYTKCHITDYFVHTVDSKGKFRFLEDNNSDIEIREVTKFDCTGFTVSLDQ